MGDDRDHPIPTHIHLGPYRVPIRQVKPQTIRRLLRLCKGEPDAAGCWLVERRAIYIDGSITLHRRWDVYWHEIRHAAVDLEALQKGGL